MGCLLRLSSTSLKPAPGWTTPVPPGGLNQQLERVLSEHMFQLHAHADSWYIYIYRWPYGWSDRCLVLLSLVLYVWFPLTYSYKHVFSLRTHRQPCRLRQGAGDSMLCSVVAAVEEAVATVEKPERPGHAPC